MVRYNAAPDKREFLENKVERNAKTKSPDKANEIDGWAYLFPKVVKLFHYCPVFVIT